MTCFFVWFLKRSVRTAIFIKCDVKIIFKFPTAFNKNLQAFLLDLILNIFVYLSKTDSLSFLNANSLSSL